MSDIIYELFIFMNYLSTPNSLLNVNNHKL